MSAVPGFFDLVAPALPLTPVLHGVLAVLTGGSGLTGAVGLTLLWLLLGVTASLGAILRRRTVSPRLFSPRNPPLAPTAPHPSS